MPARYFLENKSAYVADSVLANYFAHDPEQVSLFPILDHISLLFQRPLDINVGVLQRGKLTLVFSNSATGTAKDVATSILGDPARRRDCIRIPKPTDGAEEDIFILVRDIVTEGGRQACRLLGEADAKQLRNFIDYLADDNSFSIYRVFQRSKPRGVAVPNTVSLTRRPDEPLLEAEEIARLTRNLSRELDYLYQSLSATRGQVHRTLKQRIGNIFCVARYVGKGTKVRQGRFPYSAQVVLSGQQAAEIDKFNDYRTEVRALNIDPSVLLQQPLGETSRSIADAIFQSGIIEFPSESFGEGRDSVVDSGLNSTTENARRKLERKFLAGFGRRLMHVPVHVGGVPWAVFFLVLNGSSADEDWLWITRFYRACVPLLGDGLRRTMRRQFLDEFSKAIEVAFEPVFGSKDSLEPTLDIVNKRVRELCGFFPYVPPKLIKGRQPDYPWLPLERDGQSFQITIGSEEHSPYTCFADGLAHDLLQASALELKVYARLGLERAQAAYNNAKAARSEFGGALAHDVKNSTSEIISRLDAPLQVFKIPAIGKKYDVAHANLSRAHVRAMMLNAIAMSINTLFVEANPLARLGERSFPKGDIERFWRSILRLLLEIRSIHESEEESDADRRSFRLVIADSLQSLAQYHDDCKTAGATAPAYPANWEVGPDSDLNEVLQTALKAIRHEGSLKDGLRDERLGIGLAMLSEIVSNIRFNKSIADEHRGRDMIIAMDIRWSGDIPEIYLQQLHWESEHSEYRRPLKVPPGIGRTLSLFGQRPGALKVMNVSIAQDPMCRNDAAVPPGAPGRLCAYALLVHLSLLKGK